MGNNPNFSSVIGSEVLSKEMLTKIINGGRGVTPELLRSQVSNADRINLSTLIASNESKNAADLISSELGRPDLTY